jgi:uncharacterized alpha-E superfamily protein
MQVAVACVKDIGTGDAMTRRDFFDFLKIGAICERGTTPSCVT